MKEKRNVYLKVQEMCDCYATNLETEKGKS